MDALFSARKRAICPNRIPSLHLHLLPLHFLRLPLFLPFFLLLLHSVFLSSAANFDVSDFEELLTTQKYNQGLFEVFYNDQKVTSYADTTNFFTITPSIPPYKLHLSPFDLPDANDRIFANLTYVFKKGLLMSRLELDNIGDSHVDVLMTATRPPHSKISLNTTCSYHNLLLENSIFKSCSMKTRVLQRVLYLGYTYKQHSLADWWEEFTKIEIIFYLKANSQVKLNGIKLKGVDVLNKKCNCFWPGLKKSCTSSCECKKGFRSPDCYPESGGKLYPSYGPPEQTLHLYATSWLSNDTNFTIFAGPYKCRTIQTRTPVFQNGSYIEGVSRSCILALELPKNKKHQVRICWDYYCFFLDSQTFTKMPSMWIKSFSPLKSIRSGGTNIMVSGSNLNSSPNVVLDVIFMYSTTSFLISSVNASDASKRVCRSNQQGSQLTCTLPYMAYPELQLPASKISLKLRNSGNRFDVQLKLCPDPEFFDFQPEIMKYNGKNIEVKGRRLMECLTKADYSITVGTTKVSKFTMYQNVMLLTSPTNVPRSKSDKNGFSKVEVSVGNIKVIVGYVSFKRNGPPILAIALGVVAGILLIAILILIVFLKIKKKACFNREGRFSDAGESDDKEKNFLDGLMEPLKSQVMRCLVNENDLKIEEEIGAGHFGKVYKGSFGNKEVAVKMLTPAMSRVYQNRVDFLSEGIRMMDLTHRNVMTLVAIVVRNQKVPLIVLPFMKHGDLKSFVEKNENKFSTFELLTFCLQVSCGMEYLISKNIIHRDLAARNCTVDEEKCVKVTDFGLSRDIYNQNYYKAKNQTPLPFKWMALEVLEGKNQFSEKTDVWSFGVTTWEIFTWGLSPYFELSTRHVKSFLKEGKRLEKPEKCPDSVYNLMLSCWSKDPHERPAFSSLRNSIENILDTENGLG